MSQTESKKRWPCIALAMVPFVSSMWFNQEPEAAPIRGERASQSLVFDEYLLNFGPRPIAARPMIEIPFRYRNVSDQTIHIKSLTPSCNCMQPRMDSMEIAPGTIGQLVMPIQLTNEKPGPHEYLVKVMYEDTDLHEVDLGLKVVLPEKEVMVQPRAMWFFQSGEKETTQIVTITDSREKSFQVQDIRCSSKLWTVEEKTDVTDLEGNRTLTLAVTLKADAPTGRQRGIIVVYTDDKRYPAIQIPVGCQSLDSARSEGLAYVSDPETVVLKPTTEGALEATAIVRTKGGASTDVESVTAMPAFVQASLETTPDNRTIIKVSADLTEEQRTSVQRAVVTVKPRTEGSSPLTIPVVIPAQKAQKDQ